VIGLDTNILLRALTADDPRLSPVAADLLARLTPEAPGYVNVAVLAELCWTLTRRYRASRADLMQVIETLLESPAYVFSDREAVIDALEHFRQGGDQADQLILARAARAGALPVLSFDQRFSRWEGVELLVAELPD
jgi:predicted nucleic-acid-binding protein